MKNKKGFTLIEIIVTIALLALLSIVLVISLNKINENSKKSSWQKLTERVTSGASVYIENKEALKIKIYEQTGQSFIPVEEIIAEGLIDEEYITDPNDNIKITDKTDNSYHTVKAYLNKNGAIEFEYPSTAQNYLLTMPKNIRVYSTQKINLMTTGEIKECNKNDVCNNIIVANLTIKYKGNKVTNPTAFSFSSSESGLQEINYEYKTVVEGKQTTITGKRYYNVVTIPTPSCEIIATGTKFTYGAATDNWYKSDVSLKLKALANDNEVMITEFGLTTATAITYNKLNSASITTNTTGTTYYGYVKNSLNGTNSCQITIKRDNVTPTISFSSVPASAKRGTSVAIPTSVTYGTAGGTTICKENTTTITNISSLSTGSHTISCTASGNNGLTKTESKTISITSTTSSSGCTRNSDCSSGRICSGGSCILDDDDDECTRDSQCGTGYECSGGSCHRAQSSCCTSTSCGSGYECSGCSCTKKTTTPTTPTCCTSTSCGSGYKCSSCSCVKKTTSGGSSGSSKVTCSCRGCGGNAHPTTETGANMDECLEKCESYGCTW